VKNVPLPNQLPKGIDFKELPGAAFKSATLEALISQNEDLMARLRWPCAKAASWKNVLAFSNKTTPNTGANLNPCASSIWFCRKRIAWPATVT